MNDEIVYVPKLDELHWYGCAKIKRLPEFTPWVEVSVEDVTCSTCFPILAGVQV